MLRRDFLKMAGIAAIGMSLGTRKSWADETVSLNVQTSRQFANNFLSEYAPSERLHAGDVYPF